MISTEINKFINKIMCKTQNKELHWLYVQSILDEKSVFQNKYKSQKQTLLPFFSSNNNDHNSDPYDALPTAIKTLLKYYNDDSNGSSISFRDSFYLQNENKYLFLLHIIRLPNQNRSFEETWELFAIFNPLDKTYTPIPDYHPAGESDRLKKLSELIVEIKTEEDEQKEKTLLDFLDSFL